MGGLRITSKLINFGPIILLYYLSFSEVDSHFENYFEILSFNLQLIIIYFLPKFLIRLKIRYF